MKPVLLHELRSTGTTWLSVRGDEPLRIQQRAGHTDLQTTLGYIREVEVFHDGFGRSFPERPECILAGEQAVETIGDSQDLGNTALLLDAPGSRSARVQ